jgi:hypothetical protein
MLLRLLHRSLLRLGYRLPRRLQKPFRRFLYDGPLSQSDRQAITAADQSDRPIRFEFTGGSRDGQVYEGVLANPFYWQSDQGRIGARFSVATNDAVEAMLDGEATGPILDQEYEIVENRLENGVRYVRAEHGQRKRSGT